MFFSTATNYYEPSPIFVNRYRAGGETSFLIYKFSAITMGW